MKISEELKARALREWFLCSNKFPEITHPMGAAHVSIPFLFDGVLDRVDYNTKTKRFEKIHLRMENGQDEIIDIPN